MYGRMNRVEFRENVSAFFHQGHSLRASSRIWASEASLARSSRVLTRLALLAQIGELARGLPGTK